MLTPCLPGQHREEVAGRVTGPGCEAPEVAAWPAPVDRPSTASHVEVNAPDAARSAADTQKDPLWGRTEDEVRTGPQVTYRPLIVA